MIGKGTGQPGLDAENHGRNSPATTVRKQEGRELQGQREQVKITHENPKREAGRAQNGKWAPLSHPLPSEGWLWKGRWGGKHSPAPTTVPQLHGDSSTSRCSHRQEKRQRRRGAARAQPSTPPAQPGRVPASPRGFPKAVQSWQACGDSLEPGRQHRGCFPTVSSTGSAHSTPGATAPEHR